MGISRTKESGQALIEYLALLFVGTLMVLGLVYQFNDAFRQYLDAWFGSNDGGYLFCLIQNGYLPGESGICTPPEFNLKNGKTKSSVGGTSGAGGNASASGASGKAGANGFAGSSPVGGEGGGGGRRLIPVGPNFGSKGKGSSAGGAGSKEATGSVDASSSSVVTSAGAARSGASQNQNRSRYVPITEDDSSGGSTIAKTIPATDQELKPQARYVAADKPRKKEVADDDLNKKFTFGNILKYVIIIFILFSIFFFIGSQLLAISQGGKKRR